MYQDKQYDDKPFDFRVFKITQLINMNVYFLQTELIGITNRKRKPPLKEDAVPSIFSYVPEKKVRQSSIDRANRQSKREVSFHYN